MSIRTPTRTKMGSLGSKENWLITLEIPVIFSINKKNNNTVILIVDTSAADEGKTEDHVSKPEISRYSQRKIILHPDTSPMLLP